MESFLLHPDSQLQSSLSVNFVQRKSHMYFFCSLAIVLLLVGSSIAINGHTSGLVAANLRSPNANAAAIEPLSVEEDWLRSKARDDVFLRVSKRVAALIPRVPQDGVPPAAKAPNPATVPKSPTGPTEPEGSPDPPTDPTPQTGPTGPEGPQSPAQQQPPKKQDSDDDDDDDDDGDPPDTPEQPKGQKESGGDEGDGGDDTDTGDSDVDDGNSSTTSKCAKPTGTASARCISAATSRLTPTKAAVSTSATTSSTSSSSFAATTTPSTVQEVAPASTASAPTTPSFTAAAAGMEAQNPFVWVQWGPRRSGGIATIVGVYIAVYISCLNLCFRDGR